MVKDQKWEELRDASKAVGRLEKVLLDADEEKHCWTEAAATATLAETQLQLAASCPELEHHFWSLSKWASAGFQIPPLQHTQKNASSVGLDIADMLAFASDWDGIWPDMKKKLVAGDEWETLDTWASAREVLGQDLFGTSLGDLQAALLPVMDVAATCATLASMPSFHKLQHLLGAPIELCSAAAPGANVSVAETLRTVVEAVEAAWSLSKEALVAKEFWQEILHIEANLKMLMEAHTRSQRQEASNDIQDFAGLDGVVANMQLLQATAQFAGVSELQLAIAALQPHVPCDESNQGAAKRRRTAA
jgi:hypothetical protein